MGRIITIGRSNPGQDNSALSILATWLLTHGSSDLARRLDRGDFVDYDMSLYPERGDGVDAVRDTPDIDLVVALHLFGIDQIPQPSNRHTEDTFLYSGYLYNKQNGYLLQECMGRRIPLAVWGDQPWLGMQARTRVHHNNFWFYEAFPR